ncbi:hypothetical protein BV006_00845B, partial [Haemophilus influenzae]
VGILKVVQFVKKG